MLTMRNVMDGIRHNPGVLDWAWRGVVFALLAAQLWLQSHYVPRTEYAQDKRDLTKALDGITATMQTFHTSLELLKLGTQQLMDHETRIRTLESHDRNPAR